jgi:hypothetical protein
VIEISADTDINMLYIMIKDNGHGMSAEMVRQVTDPFVTTRTTRSVGLGIPLLKEHCELTGGRLILESEPDKGTIITASFGLYSIDRMPLGDISDTIAALVLSAPAVNYLIRFHCQDRDFELDWQDIRIQLEDVPLTEPAVLEWIQGNVAEQQQYIFGGVLNEITG